MRPQFIANRAGHDCGRSRETVAVEASSHDATSPIPGLNPRLGRRSLILTSQLPVTRWHEQIGDPTVADGILDRLLHNAHRIEMRGDSMRKNRGKQPST